MSCETREVKQLTKGHRAGKRRCRRVTTSEPDAAVRTVTQQAGRWVSGPAGGCEKRNSGSARGLPFLLVALQTVGRSRCVNLTDVFYLTPYVQNITISTSPKYKRQITRHVLLLPTECPNLVCTLHEQHISFQTHHMSNVQ